MSASGRCRKTGAHIFILYFGRNIDYPVLLLLLAARTVWLNIFCLHVSCGDLFKRKICVTAEFREKKKILWAMKLCLMNVTLNTWVEGGSIGIVALDNERIWYAIWVSLWISSLKNLCPSRGTKKLPFLFSEKLYYFSCIFKSFSHHLIGFRVRNYVWVKLLIQHTDLSLFPESFLEQIFLYWWNCSGTALENYLTVDMYT